MFNLPDSLLILAAFGLFLPFETGVNRFVPVRVSIRIEDPDIHECFLIPGAPETTCTDVRSGLIVSDGSAKLHDLPGQWLQMWF